MPVTLSLVLRACCVALALALAVARGAEQPNPLLGATKDQVLTRYGEPKSQIAAGDRLIFFYPRERIVFRGDVVVEVEAIAPEPVRRPPPPPEESTAPATTPSETQTGVTPSPDPSAATTPGPGPTSPAAPEAETTTAPSEPKVEIKLVRPPSKDGRPAPPLSTSTPSAETPTTTPPASTPAPKVEPPVETTTPAAAPKSTQPMPSPTDPSAAARAGPSAAEVMRAAELAAKQEEEQKAQAAKEARRRLDEAVATEPPREGVSISPMVIVGTVLALGLIFLVWRFRQRQVELAATSVGNTASTTSTAPARPAGNQFTEEFLGSLEWKRFEELVAAYYNKTGVVATRTNTGPQSPVHIKISWKGEARPFAYVQCIAHPSGLVEAKPVKDFVAALAADDIRRGYVVTSGKFSVPARDLAEEKQLALLPGDLFLEKLNALPPPARAEIMRAVGLGA